MYYDLDLFLIDLTYSLYLRENILRAIAKLTKVDQFCPFFSKRMLSITTRPNPVDINIFLFLYLFCE